MLLSCKTREYLERAGLTATIRLASNLNAVATVPMVTVFRFRSEFTVSEVVGCYHACPASCCQPHSPGKLKRSVLSCNPCRLCKEYFVAGQNQHFLILMIVKPAVSIQSCRGGRFS